MSTLCSKNVTQKILNMVTTFSKLARYPKKKKENKTFDDLKTFTEETEMLFSIVYKNLDQRRYREAQYTQR